MKMGWLDLWDMVNTETVFEDPDDGTDEPDTAEPTDSAEPEDTATPDTTEPNQAPIADAGQDRQVVVGQVVSLSGSLSSDPDGDAIQVSAAAQRTGNSDSGWHHSHPEITFTEAGTGTFELSIYDGSLYAIPDTVEVTAVASNQNKEGTSCQSFPYWVPLWLSPLCLLRRNRFQSRKA